MSHICDTGLIWVNLEKKSYILPGYFTVAAKAGPENWTFNAKRRKIHSL